MEQENSILKKCVDLKDDYSDEWKNESENEMELICDDEQNIKKESKDELTVEGM